MPLEAGSDVEWNENVCKRACADRNDDNNDNNTPDNNNRSRRRKKKCVVDVTVREDPFRVHVYQAINGFKCKPRRRIGTDRIIHRLGIFKIREFLLEA